MVFSKDYREDFLLDFDKYTFLNHGSYGAVPKVNKKQYPYDKGLVMFFLLSGSRSGFFKKLSREGSSRKLKNIFEW